MTESAKAIAFVCAMPMELKPLVRKLSLEAATRDGRKEWTGSLAGHPVVAIVTGMGTALARAGVVPLLDSHEIARVVVVGITGAVRDETPIGELIVPVAVIDSASGSEHQPAPLGGHEPNGKMWTTDSLTTDPTVLADLRERGVVSLDMETAAIAQECEARSIPWSVFRCISDRATDGSVDEEVFKLSNQDGTPNPANIVRYVLRHPGKVPRMARMGREVKLATERAADIAIAACRATSP